MDSIITVIVDKLLELGLSEEIFLVILFLGFIYTIFQGFLKPIREKLNLIPTEDYHKEAFKTQQQLIEEEKRELIERLENLEKTLVQVKETMVGSDFRIVNALKEVEKINDEVQHIKLVLSQFHGHMIYNRSDAFRNKGIE